MKVAIVHDGLATAGGRGGAEWVLMVLKDLFPEAPVYTTVYHPDRMPEAFRHFQIRTSCIQRLPSGRTRYQAYLPLMPTAVEQFDLSGYDVVLSCNHSVAKGVLTPPDTLHVCYCYTPLRYAWDMYHDYLRVTRLGRLARFCIPPLMTYMRIWDTLSSKRVDAFIAISHYVARRIRKYYRRDAVVIYPPVETSAFSVSDTLAPSFLVVSRLVPYKRIDLAVQAFNQVGRPLVIIGDGPERARLQRLAQPNITFLGRQPDAVVREHLATCQALIFPGQEDFGITPLEAQASGRPVIAYQEGGVLETVTDATGRFFFPHTAEALAKAVKHFDAGQFDGQVIRRHAARFDVAVFRRQITEFLEQQLNCSGGSASRA
jgi:glycosyltransferase involved in cell wall biosynthesis